MPKKTNYIFPSNLLAKHINDELYSDLYFGDYMNIKEGEIIGKNIPMDPLKFDWNEFAKNKDNIFHFYSKRERSLARISNYLFIFGFIVSAVALAFSPKIYNVVIVVLYVGMFFIRRMSFKSSAKGRLLDQNNSSLPFALVRVFSSATDVEIAHKVADQMGRYHLLVPKGSYYVKIEKKNDDGSYSLVKTTEVMQIENGVLNKVFKV